MQSISKLLIIASLLGIAACQVGNSSNKYAIPADFPWSSIDFGPQESWMGLYMNLSDPSTAVHTKALAIGHQRYTADSAVILSIPFVLGFAWQTAKVALTVAGLASTINTCKQDLGVPETLFFCLVGIAGTVYSIGGHVSAAKTFVNNRGWLASAANTWDQSGLEQIELDVFNKRSYVDDAESTAQKAHNHIVHDAVRTMSVTEPQFLGYAPDFHRLAKRSSDVHPFAPMFRFTHPKHGEMDIVSRDFGDMGVHFTIAYADHPGHLKRDEYFQHERLDTNLMEARFDSLASQSDFADISFDAAGSFDQIESQLECFLGGEWRGGSVLSAQYFDNANEATFGFADIGVFPDHSVDSQLSNFDSTAQLPLQGGLNC